MQHYYHGRRQLVNKIAVTFVGSQILYHATLINWQHHWAYLLMLQCLCQPALHGAHCRWAAEYACLLLLRMPWNGQTDCIATLPSIVLQGRQDFMGLPVQPKASIHSVQQQSTTPLLQQVGWAFNPQLFRDPRQPSQGSPATGLVPILPDSRGSATK